MASDTGGDLPAGIGNPARRALATIGCERLEQVAPVGKRELLALHGVGPKAVGILRQALDACGQRFKETPGSAVASGPEATRGAAAVGAGSGRRD